MKIIIAVFLICFSIVALIFIKEVAKQEIADLAQWIVNVRTWYSRRRKELANRKVFEQRNARQIRFDKEGKKEYCDEVSHHSL